MKTLPDNPSLPHLRQQAKDLLAGLRDSEPAASLADAQASLAEQYGFRSWTDLKAEVDRMRGGADVADPALAREIAARYGLGEVTGTMHSMSRPDEVGRQWALRTDRGRWAVRTLDNLYPMVDVETDVALQRAAAGAGVLLPAPVRSRSGAVVEPIGGHRWRVYEWQHSGPPLVAPVSSTIAYQVGEILARLHLLELPVDRISPWHATRLSDVDWQDLVRQAQASPSGAGWAEALAGAVRVLADLDAIGETAPRSAPVLSHNSLGPGNARRPGPDRRLIVTGWEHAGGQPPDWEVGDALTHWATGPSGQVNAAAARALVEGYRSLAGSPPALDMSVFSGAATSLVNYVAGEVSQAVQAMSEEDRRYQDRNLQHLLSHLPSRDTFGELLAALR